MRSIEEKEREKAAIRERPIFDGEEKSVLPQADQKCIQIVITEVIA